MKRKCLAMFFVATLLFSFSSCEKEQVSVNNVSVTIPILLEGDAAIAFKLTNLRTGEERSSASVHNDTVIANVNDTIQMSAKIVDKYKALDFTISCNVVHNTQHGTVTSSGGSTLSSDDTYTYKFNVSSEGIYHAKILAKHEQHIDSAEYVVKAIKP